MINKQLFNKCKSIIAKEKITNEEFNYCERILTNFLKIDSNNDKVYVLLGKLFLINNNTEKAKYYFDQVVNVNSNNIMVYYGLFKTNILDKDYKSAKENLNKYIKIQNNDRLNLELYKMLVDKNLNIESDYNIDDTFFYEKLNGENLILYLNGVKLILEGNYLKAIQIFETLDAKVKEEKIFISFKYIIELINNFAIKKNLTDEDFNQLIELLKDYIWDNDIEKINKIVNKLLDFKLNQYQKTLLLHQIPDLLYIDEYEVPRKINNSIKQNDEKNECSKMTIFYDKLIDELNEIYNLKGSQKENFQNLLSLGIEQITAKDYKEALYIFNTGLYKTGINLFYYYCGKTNYLLKKYKKAQFYLNIYNNSGAYKLFTCKDYLSRIKSKAGKKGKSIKLINDAKFFAELSNKKYEVRFGEASEDKYLDRLFETINMTEEDFLKGNNKVLTK